MTFDDGIARICREVMSSAPGDMPKNGLKEIGSFYYGYSEYGVSVSRYTAAQSVGHTVTAVINIDLCRELCERDVVFLDDGTKCRIYQVQHRKDDAGLWFTVLSLERYNSDDQ